MEQQLSMFGTKAEAEPEQFTYYERKAYQYDPKRDHKGWSLERRIIDAATLYNEKTGIVANLAEISDKESDPLTEAWAVKEYVKVVRRSYISVSNIFVSRV